MPIPKEKRTYPNDFDNERFVAWHKHRCQCRYRKEAYALSVEDWFALWPKKLWERRGRGRNSVCLVRKDNKGSWSLANCEVILRLEQLRRSAKEREAEHRKYRKWT